jgi:hypothetical protein
MTEVFVEPDYKTAFERLGLTSIKAIFSFQAGRNLAKKNLAPHRSRIEFQIYPPGRIESPAATVFLKRYDHTPIMTQLKNWLSSKKRVVCALAEVEAAHKLAAIGINTPKVIAFGRQSGLFFEKRSFIITEKIPNADSLERKLPDCFYAPHTTRNLKMRRDFIAKLAAFVRKFHDTGYRHRDLYLAHIFYGSSGVFYLIDLARAFKPLLLTALYRLKDIAQLYYSAPARHFSHTDRLRFFFAYTGRDKLAANDKRFIKKVLNKANRIARHDAKHGRGIPFLT